MPAKASKTSRKAREPFYAKVLKSWGFEHFGLYWTRRIQIDSGYFGVRLEDSNLRAMGKPSIETLVMGLIVTAYIGGRDSALPSTEAMSKLRGKVEAIKGIVNGL